MDLYSENWTSKLVKYIKGILQVIPHRVFEIMNVIYTIFSKKEMSNEIHKKNLKDYAQVKERFELARAAHDI